MNKKSKKIASLVLGVALAGSAMTGCMGAKSSCSGMKDKTTKKASCGASGCGSTMKK